ncbi:MAG: LD-carboxypeptidase, partial [Lachnospiraceae bacterium]|nr:LD-carboxypeptidase [Lachnospiraceae bacterium]
YGPCAAQFGRPWTRTEEDAFAILEGKSSSVCGYEKYELPFGGEDEPETEKDPLAPYVFTEPKILSSFIPDGKSMRRAGSHEAIEMKGTLLGGCLDILTNLAGTEFDRVRDFIREHGDIIWVIEACDLTPMAIRRALWSLSHCGWFDTASGFLVGRPLAAYGQDQMGVNQYNAVLDMLDRYGVPVIMDCDIGHIAPMMPLVIGAETYVRVIGNDIKLDMHFDI